MYTLQKPISYDEFLQHIHEGIVMETGECPITPVLMLFQGKWKNQVIYELCCSGTCRFGELKKALTGITNATLTNTLRELEEGGIITRKQFNEIPPHVEYSLSEKGNDLLPVFYAMMNWGFKHENT